MQLLFHRRNWRFIFKTAAREASRINEVTSRIFVCVFRVLAWLCLCFTWYCWLRPQTQFHKKAFNNVYVLARLQAFHHSGIEGKVMGNISRNYWSLILLDEILMPGCRLSFFLFICTLMSNKFVSGYVYPRYNNYLLQAIKRSRNQKDVYRDHGSGEQSAQTRPSIQHPTLSYMCT